MIKIEIKNVEELSSFVIKKGKKIVLLHNLSENEKVKLFNDIVNSDAIVKR